MNVRLYFGAKMVTFCVIHIGNRKLFLKYHSPELILLHVSVYIGYPIFIFYMIYIIYIYPIFIFYVIYVKS